MARGDNPAIRQGSFAAGEIAPVMYGRLDFKKHKTALRKCQNWIVTQHGALVNRPGTKFIAAVKDSGQKARLVPFIFSNEQAIVMEFGAGYVRFYRNGAQIKSGGRPVEVVTPYGSGDLFKLKFAQSGDVVTITRQGYEPKDLRRLTADNLSWDLIPTIPINPPNAPFAVWLQNCPGLHDLIDPDGVGINPKYIAWSNPANSMLEYAITAVYLNDNGTTRESLPVIVPAGHIDREAANPVLVIQPAPGDLPYTYNVYGGREGYYGFIDAIDGPRSAFSASSRLPSVTVPPGTRSFVDAGTLPPDYSIQPPTWTYPFKQAVIDWTPRTYFGPGSRVYASGKTFEIITPGVSGGAPPDALGGTVRDGAPEWAWDAAYGVGDYAVVNGVTCRCSAAGVSSDRFSPLLVVNAALGIFTEGGVAWQRVASAGAATWRMVRAGRAAAEYPAVVTYFDQRKLFSTFASDPSKIVGSRTGNYQNFDVTTPPLDSDGVSFSLASQRYEEIRSFVQLRMALALTSERDWAISGAAGGSLSPTSLLARPNNVRGASWLDPLVVGTTALYVQALGTQIWELVFDYYTQSYLGSDQTLLAQHLFQGRQIVDWAYAPVPYSVAWAVRDDGALLGFTYVREQEIAAWHRHFTDGAFESVCAIPETIDGVAETGVYVEAKRTLGSGAEVRYIERFASRYVPDVTQGIFLDCAVVKTGTAIAGLEHLEGKAVTVLADGMVAGPYTVLHGAIDISEAFPDAPTTVIVGLPYVSDIEALDLAIEEKNLRLNAKAVYRVGVEMVETRGLQVGPDFEHLTEWAQRKVKDGFLAIEPFSGLAQIRINSRYEVNGRVVLRHSDPLPATIIGLSREVNFGGD